MWRRCLTLLVLLLSPGSGLACGAPICLVPVDSLNLTRIITFDDVPSGYGLGSRIDEVLRRPGARFGERFAGQSRLAEGNHDRITGSALAPLTIIAGGAGENLGAMRLLGTNILLGHGPRRYPMAEAVGEGAIAALFDRDQSALAFELRGGEQGFAMVAFLRRDGSLIHTMRLGPISEQTFTFLRAGRIADIAGLLLVNNDPQGVAIDNLRFDLADPTS